MEKMEREGKKGSLERAGKAGRPGKQSKANGRKRQGAWEKEGRQNDTGSREKEISGKPSGSGGKKGGQNRLGNREKEGAWNYSGSYKKEIGGKPFGSDEKERRRRNAGSGERKGSQNYIGSHDKKGRQDNIGSYGKEGRQDNIGSYGKKGRQDNIGSYGKEGRQDNIGSYGKEGRQNYTRSRRKEDRQNDIRGRDKKGHRNDVGSYEKKGRQNYIGNYEKEGNHSYTGRSEKEGSGNHPGSYKREKRYEKLNGWEKENRSGKQERLSYGSEKNMAENRRQGGRKQQKEAGEKICRAFGECGGCQLLGVPYEAQLAEKEKDLARLLKPYVKLEGMIGMEEPEHYRNKVNAAFTHDRSGKALSGVYKEGTHYIIPIKECVLENRKADEIIGSIRKLLPSFKIKTYDEDMDYGLLRHVMVRTGHATGQIMVTLVLADPVLPSKKNFVRELLKLHPDITTIIVNVNNRKTSMVLGEKEQVIYGKGYIEDVLCGITFKISPKSFYQVNSIQAEKLYEKAIEYAGLTGEETVLDAYCGIGTIGMVAASKARRVIGVELNGDAVKDAVANARKNKIKNIEFYQKDAGEFMLQLANQGEKIDTVFLDPPRTGSDEVFLDSLAALNPQRVVYISCNPETLVRDLEILVKKGYRVVRGMGCDMFPFCSHIECVVGMQRKHI